MQRRDFLSTSAVVLTGGWAYSQSDAATTPTFRFAARAGMFKHLAGESISTQIDFAAEQGFVAFEECQLLKRNSIDLRQESRLLRQHGMTWGAAIAWEEYGRSLFDTACRNEFQREMNRVLQAAGEIDELRFGVVVPGRLDRDRSRDDQIEQFHRLLLPIVDEAAACRLTILLKPHHSHYGSSPMLLETVEDAVAVCERIDRPSLKILYDTYEQAMNGRGIVDDLTNYKRQVGYLHLGDAPGNKEPGTGSIRFDELIARLRETRFDGIIGLDHGRSRPGIDGEIAVLEGYRRLLASSVVPFV